MKYKLEVFDFNDQSWYVRKSSNSLSYLLYLLELYKKTYPEDHFRVVKLIKFV